MMPPGAPRGPNISEDHIRVSPLGFLWETILVTCLRGLSVVFEGFREQFRLYSGKMLVVFVCFCVRYTFLVAGRALQNAIRTLIYNT